MEPQQKYRPGTIRNIKLLGGLLLLSNYIEAWTVFLPSRTYVIIIIECFIHIYVLIHYLTHGLSLQTSGSYNSLLKIGDVSPVHDGNYTCHAHNMAATVSYTVELRVNGKNLQFVRPSCL